MREAYPAAQGSGDSTTFRSRRSGCFRFAQPGQSRTTSCFFQPRLAAVGGKRRSMAATACTDWVDGAATPLPLPESHAVALRRGGTKYKIARQRNSSAPMATYRYESPYK